MPSYVRSEIKKKTGMVIDEYGNKVDEIGEITNGHVNDMFNIKPQPQTKVVKSAMKQQKNFTPIHSYKPQGNFIYDNDLLSTLEEKIT